MGGALRRALAAVAVCLAVTVVAAATPAYANGKPTRLDTATASVIADDFGHWGADDVGPAEMDATPEVRRCIRLGAFRVDCVVEISYEGALYSVAVVVVELVGWRLHYDLYYAGSDPPYPKADTIEVSPSDFRIRPIASFYRRVHGVYRPELLVHRQVGWGRPKLPDVIVSQCELQPRLPCAGNLR